MIRILILLLCSLGTFGAYGQSSAKTSGEYAILLKLAPRYQADSAWTAADNAAVAEHFAALQKLQQEGKLIFAGRTTNPASQGIVVLKGLSEAEARAVIAADKAVQRGIMYAELQPFHTALKERK